MSNFIGEDLTTFQWTFKTRWGGREDWVTSAGRWETLRQASDKACEWIVVCAENDCTCSVEVIAVSELDIEPEHKRFMA